MRLQPKHLLFFIPPAVVVVWTIFLYQFPPEDIVDYFGTSNGYLATLILSFIGGISTFITIPYHLLLMTFAAGGLSPWLLGALATVGQGVGDTTSYVLGYSGSGIAPSSLRTLVKRLLDWCEGRAYWQIAGALFVYGSISPLSNDFILIPMGMARYPYKKVMIPLMCGNFVFNAGAGLIGVYGLSSILNS